MLAKLMVRLADKAMPGAPYLGRCPPRDIYQLVITVLFDGDITTWLIYPPVQNWTGGKIVLAIAWNCYAQDCSRGNQSTNRTRQPQPENSIRLRGHMLQWGKTSSPRKWVWIELTDFMGLGCSQCLWTFDPAEPPPGKSLQEMRQNYQAQLSAEFAIHTCVSVDEIYRVDEMQES
jgi:hypothetical protein